MWRTRLFVGGLSIFFGASGCADSTSSATRPARLETRKTAGQTTQTVLELEQARAAGGVPADLSDAGAGLTVAANSSRISMGKLGILSVEQKLRLYRAEHDAVPETYAEFMEKIIEPGKPTGLRLPMLPYYQEYAYDPATKAVVVLEFPAKKQQRAKETTGAAGL